VSKISDDDTLNAEKQILVAAASSSNAQLSAEEALTTAYRERVRRIAADADGKEVIQNRTPDHAGIIISALFENAKNDVRIICDRLSDVAYGKDEVIAAAKKFVEDGGKIQIVIEEAVSYPESRFLTAFRDLIETEKLDLRLVSPPIKEKYAFHFMVADDAHYRFQRDRKKFHASARFGAPEANVWKIDAFGKIQAHSVKYDPAKAEDFSAQVEIPSNV
jgi:hypothetical protein